MQTKPYLIPFIIIVSLAQGCSFSYSSKSSSNSSVSSSESSVSSSSSPSSSITEEDISDYTIAYLSNEKFERSSFSRGISAIATANGVTSWEQDEATLIAIGRGLKEADIPEGVFQTYKSSIVDANPLAMDLIQKGYAEE